MVVFWVSSIYMYIYQRYIIYVDSGVTVYIISN